MDVSTELKNQGGRSVHHTQSTSPTTQETLPVSPQNPNAHPSHIQKYSDIFRIFGISRSSSDSEIFRDIRKYSFPNEWETHGGATTTGPDATYPPAICQNSGGGGGGGGGVWPGVGGGVKPGVGGGGLPGVRGASDGVRGGGGVRVRVTELVEPVLVL